MGVQNFHFEEKEDFVRKVLGHPHLTEIIGSARIHSDNLSTAIVKNLKHSLNHVKGIHSKDQLGAKRLTLHIIANTKYVQLKKHHRNTQIAKALSIHPRDLEKHRVNIHSGSL